MLPSTTFLTTVVAPGLQPLFFERKPKAIKLYFHIVLRMDGEQLDDERSRLFKQYIASYVRTTGGSLKAAGCGQNKIYLLVGLNHTRSLADFVRDLKLVSRTYARRKLNAPGFFWQDEYEAFSVSLSQLERVRGYIGRQLKLESQESYASSWQPLTASKMY